MVSEALGRVINRYEIDSRIVETIAFNPHATIDLIAKETGLSYTAVRNGLHRLVELGVIAQTEAIGGPGRRGRPAALFSLERGLRIQIPPRNFDHLADILIEKLASQPVNKEFVGMKPGETSFEELMTEEEAKKVIELEDMFVLLPFVAKGFVSQNRLFFDELARNYPNPVFNDNIK